MAGCVGEAPSMASACSETVAAPRRKTYLTIGPGSARRREGRNRRRSGGRAMDFACVRAGMLFRDRAASMRCCCCEGQEFGAGGLYWPGQTWFCLDLTR